MKIIEDHNITSIISLDIANCSRWRKLHDPVGVFVRRPKRSLEDPWSAAGFCLDEKSVLSC